MKSTTYAGVVCIVFWWVWATENEECSKYVRIDTSGAWFDLFLWSHGPGFGFKEDHGHPYDRSVGAATGIALRIEWQPEHSGQLDGAES